MKKMHFYCLLLFTNCIFLYSFLPAQETTWIRINQLGYPTHSKKTAVWCSKLSQPIIRFELVDAASKKTVYTNKAGKAFGAYGPFAETYRLDFSLFNKPGRYFLKAGNIQSPVFIINDSAYKGSADFCLKYMRQQRSGFNPFLNDSCHTHDGYTMYGPMPDSTHIDVVGGWHDASDYLQYSSTSANATYHLLAAYRDFPTVFSDRKQANGLDGKNGVADVLDEAKWGLDWLLKMHPKEDWLFNQLGDDRDHKGMRIPKEDAYYGKGFERPVYFVTGEIQQRGKFMNNTTGTSSIAGKFSSAFALGSASYASSDPDFASLLQKKAMSAWNYGLKKPGVTQTVSVLSPYIYAEDNWVDDMELAGINMYELPGGNDPAKLSAAYAYAKQEPITPWLGADTAKHYQWYPFINLGHYELAKQLKGTQRDTIVNYYKEGIEKVWNKAKSNAFYRGIPFIWCSNNLTVSFAIQCYWYEQLTKDNRFSELEQANFDWLFGCNPWGTSMVYGLPASGVTPVDPHSAFTHLKKYPIDGGLVDGPVYTSIYKGLIGIHLNDADEYAPFQSDLAVYHDDYGDYSTNEPTMDGTASLVYLLAAKEQESVDDKSIDEKWQGAMASNIAYRFSHKAIIRGDSTKKQIALVFTGDEFGDGLNTIANTLEKQQVKGAFFFTGRFYRNKDFQPGITKLYKQKNLMGPHSDSHLLYCDWNKRDSMLVTKDSLFADLYRNEDAMVAAGIKDADIGKMFIPPYEWWNDKIGGWMDTAKIKLFCFTPGTTSNADYTYPEMGAAYRSSDAIMASIKKFNETTTAGLNGVVLLIHIGTDPRRKDKLYNRLDELIGYLKKNGYQFKRVDEMLR
jgi:peptidoglycan/xylan/chitin deacetylase (PgdA/CDA1 family)